VPFVTLPAVTENVAEVAPCGTVTDAATLTTAAFELDSETTAPPAPAGDVRLTVPFADWPLTIVLELNVRLLNVGSKGFTVRPDVTLAPE
jgi:hypothetical protein